MLLYCVTVTSVTVRDFSCIRKGQVFGWYTLSAQNTTAHVEWELFISCFVGFYPEMADGPVQTGPAVPNHGPVSKFGPCAIVCRINGQIPKRLVKDRSWIGPQQTSPKIGTGLADHAISGFIQPSSPQAESYDCSGSLTWNWSHNAHAQFIGMIVSSSFPLEA